MRTATKEHQQTDTIRELKKEPRVLLRLALWALAAFLFGGLRAVAGFSPFVAALMAACPFEALAGVFCGGVLGLFSSLSWPEALWHTAALLLIGLFRLVIERRFLSLRRSLLLPAVAACGVTACGLGYSAFTGVSLPGLGLLLAECAAACLSCALFLRALRLPVRSVSLADLSAADKAVLGLCGCLLLLCAASYSAFGLSPARVAAGLAVLFAAFVGGVSGGAVGGVCTGLALGLLPGTRFLFPVYAVAGLAGGVFSPRGPMVSALFFAGAAALTAFLQGFRAPVLWCLLEIFIACAVFVLIPAKRKEQLRELLKKSGLLPEPQLHYYVSANLQRAAAQVGEISDVIEQVSGKLDRVLNPELQLIFSSLQQTVCPGCKFQTACWRDRYSETAADILALAGMQEDAPQTTALERRCPRAPALKEKIAQSYTDFVSGLAAKEKIRELRGVVSDQFSTIADLLEEIAALVHGSRVADTARSRSLREALADEGQFVDALHLFTDSTGRVSVEITMLEDAFSLDFHRIRKTLQSLTGRRFQPEEIALMDLRTTITFWEKAKYRVLFGRSQIAAAEGGVCGDCVQTLTDPDGRRIALLSDGMGTGARAAVDSVLASTLLEKLLESGFTFPGALRLVNCALLVKSSDESIATADGLCINVFTGQADFYKAGAAVSFWRRGDRVTVIEDASLPIGILRTVGFAHREETLQPGDIVLLVSDGVTAPDCGWLSDELLAWSTNNMDDLASHIASLAKLRYDDETRDDITVVAAKVLENRE